MSQRYIVIVNNSLLKFEEEVEAKLAQGWKLAGGVSYIQFQRNGDSNFFETCFAQALTQQK